MMVASYTIKVVLNEVYTTLKGYYAMQWFKDFAVLVQGQLVTCPSKY